MCSLFPLLLESHTIRSFLVISLAFFTHFDIAFFVALISSNEFLIIYRFHSRDLNQQDEMKHLFNSKWECTKLIITMEHFPSISILQQNHKNYPSFDQAVFIRIMSTKLASENVEKERNLPIITNKSRLITAWFDLRLTRWNPFTHQRCFVVAWTISAER